MFFVQIDIEYFPFDRQSCSMKFGGWSYNGFLLEVSQLAVTTLFCLNCVLLLLLQSRSEYVIETRFDENGKEYQYLQQGMDLSSFYPLIISI